MLEVGASEFLSQLRPNLDSHLHELVDSVLDNLFHLPAEEHVTASNECVYRDSDRTTRRQGVYFQKCACLHAQQRI